MHNDQTAAVALKACVLRALPALRLLATAVRRVLLRAERWPAETYARQVQHSYSLHPPYARTQANKTSRQKLTQLLLHHSHVEVALSDKILQVRHVCLARVIAPLHAR